MCIQGNISIGAKSGHQVKRRCRNNFIRYNFLGDQDDGRASYTIDLPEGGYSEVVGNLIQQGPNAENSSTLLSYGAESTKPEMVLLLAQDTFVNDKDNSPAFVRTKGATEVVMRNNLFIGTGPPLETSSDPNVDSLGDLQVDVDRVWVHPKANLPSSHLPAIERVYSALLPCGPP